MHAEEKDLAALLQLQQFDLESIQAKKALDELPQRKRILELLERRRGIEVKKTQVDEMRKAADQDIARINDEDERLFAKQHIVQEKINEAKGDYRSVEAHTKELGGIAKRRNTLESQLTALGEKVGEIARVQKQVDDALRMVEKQETEQIETFKTEGGELTHRIAALKAHRTAAASDLDPALLAIYEKKARRCGGVAVTRLIGRSCSICRNQIDEGKLLQIKAEAPLSECPFCKRMMVVADA